MSDPYILLKAVASPMTKVLAICVCGFICASPKVGLLGPATRSSLSRLNVCVFLPPFLFTTLSKSINLSRLSIWWPIPLFVAFNLSLGLCLGLVLVYLLGSKRTREHRGLILAACTCGNVRFSPWLPLLYEPEPCTCLISQVGQVCYSSRTLYRVRAVSPPAAQKVSDITL